jgi:hypothetical protein
MQAVYLQLLWVWLKVDSINMFLGNPLGVAHYKKRYNGSAITELRQAIELDKKAGCFSDN